MTETTVITSGDEPHEGDVLAEAAVASAALAGAAAAKASDAQGDAEEAEATADTALHVADAALTSVVSKVDEKEARRIAREEVESVIAGLVAKAQEAPPKAESEEPPVDPQVAPPSVEKANPDSGKGLTRAHKAWLGL